MKFLKKPLLLIICLLFFFSCQKKDDSGSPIVKKKRLEPNLIKRSEEFRDKGGGIINQMRGDKGSGTFEFATANVLWKASLKTLDFIPLQSANYSGGVLITDWYSGSLESNSSIKIEVRFKGTELSTTSLDIISYKRTCKGMNCSTVKMDKDFNLDIKSKILANARKISIAEEKNKKK